MANNPQSEYPSCIGTLMYLTRIVSLGVQRIVAIVRFKSQRGGIGGGRGGIESSDGDRNRDGVLEKDKDCGGVLEGDEDRGDVLEGGRDRDGVQGGDGDRDDVLKGGKDCDGVLVAQTLLQKECEVSICDRRCCRRKCRYPGNHPSSPYSPGQTWKAWFD